MNSKISIAAYLWKKIRVDGFYDGDAFQHGIVDSF